MRSLPRLMFAGFLAAIISISASAEPYETIISNGSPANRVDIAILGDGYTAAQADLYRSQVQNAIQNYFGQEPYLEYRSFFNVHRVDVFSNQSGADHPERNPPVFVDTAFDAAYNCSGIQRLICVSTSKVNAAISRSLPAGYFDIILIIVNDTEYGGSGGAVAVFSTHQSAVELALHEGGHSFGLLADEYSGGGPSCNPNIEPPAVNSTRETNRKLIEWRHWIDPITPIPTISTVPGLPGLYEGSSYCDTGLYRPTYNSKMRNLGPPFEQINSEQLVKRIYNFVSPIDSYSPASPDIGLASNRTQDFAITTPIPLTHSLNVTWLVDGQPRGSGTSFDLSGSTLSAGTHVVQARVVDATAFVRNDPSSVLTESQTWTINVTAAERSAMFDFDGDSKADLAVRRPADNIWYFLRTTAGYTGFQYGITGDLMAPGDFDGDGKTDVAIFRPSEGQWYIAGSSIGFYVVSWGQAGDLPLPADYDGDGKADPAVYRPSNGTWYRKMSGGAISTVQFGTVEDKPQIGDFDGDGRADLAVVRPSDNTWYFLKTSAGFNGFTWGNAGDIASPGDYDGDGKTDAAVFRPSSGVWFIAGSTAGFMTRSWGALGDIPVSADYDGDANADVAVFRPSNQTWYVFGSNTGIRQVQFGAAGDVPVAGVFNY